jgi:hypothetical protein
MSGPTEADVQFVLAIMYLTFDRREFRREGTKFWPREHSRVFGEDVLSEAGSHRCICCGSLD